MLDLFTKIWAKTNFPKKFSGSDFWGTQISHSMQKVKNIGQWF